MTDQIAHLTNLRSSTSALVQGLDAERWADTDVRAPSLLPGWTRGHVLTHIARNADGVSRTVAGALRGEDVKRYPNGSEGRAADIETGSGRPALELLADVRDSADRLDVLFAAVAAADAWDRHADDRTVALHLVSRWREVEVHRVDLGGTYAPSAWPPSFVSYLVPTLVARVAERTSDALRIEVTADGSITTDLPGSSWTIGSGEPTEVTGPDWAVAAWLAGRPAPAASALSGTPELAAWM